jgi:hypothetical protein
MPVGIDLGQLDIVEDDSYYASVAIQLAEKEMQSLGLDTFRAFAAIPSDAGGEPEHLLPGIAFSDGLNDNSVSRVLGICLLESSNLFLGKFNNILGNPDLDLSCCLATSCKRCKRCSYESRTEYKTK